ncbi:hypothetical protein D3C86_1523350 [compost metagenome]
MHLNAVHPVGQRLPVGWRKRVVIQHGVGHPGSRDDVHELQAAFPERSIIDRGAWLCSSVVNAHEDDAAANQAFQAHGLLELLQHAQRIGEGCQLRSLVVAQAFVLPAVPEHVIDRDADDLLRRPVAEVEIDDEFVLLERREPDSRRLLVLPVVELGTDAGEAPDVVRDLGLLDYRVFVAATRSPVVLSRLRHVWCLHRIWSRPKRPWLCYRHHRRLRGNRQQ